MTIRAVDWLRVLLVAATWAGVAAASPAPLIFTETTSRSGIAYAGPSWSVAWGDVNGDALPDIYLGNHGAPHNLFLNGGRGLFTEAPDGMLDRGLRTDAHGAAWADFDNDGDQDLLEVVGANRGTGTKSNHLFVNEGGALHNQGIARGIDDPLGRGRRPLWFDWDGDGRLDVLVLNAARLEAPSVLFRSNYGYFENTRAIGDLGFTKYPLLGSFASGMTNLLISGYPFPHFVYDAHQTSALPLTDLRPALRIPLQGEQVMDAALLDVNGDGVDDIFGIKGVIPSDAMISGNRVLGRIQIDDAGGARGFDFKATGSIEVMIAPRSPQWWYPDIVYIGAAGRHPSGIPFKLSPYDLSVDGLHAPTGARGVYVGYDRAAGTWQVRVVSNVYEEANFSIAASAVAALKSVGFALFAPSRRPVLLLSATDRFVDASAAAGLTVAPASNCFSGVPADFDNDGDVDVFAACSGPLARQGVANQLFRNDGAGHFALVPGAGGVSRVEAGVADGVAAADYDLDGFVDLVVTNGQGTWPFNVGPTQVFRNVSQQAGNANHWVAIDLRGVKSNRDGIGARVVLTAGGRTQWRMQRNGVHNGAQDSSRIHFGLGSAATIQSLEVVWPNGARQTMHDLPADRILRIVEGQPWSVPFALQPGSQAFGSQPVSSSTVRSFTLTNSRSVALAIRAVRPVGVQGGEFAVAHDCGRSLQARASCVVRVTFRPTSTGAKSARLMVVADDGYVVLAKLTGSGA